MSIYIYSNAQIAERNRTRGSLHRVMKNFENEIFLTFLTYSCVVREKFKKDDTLYKWDHFCRGGGHFCRGGPFLSKQRSKNRGAVN